MVWTSLDEIVKNNLLSCGLPRHYYIEGLALASNCLRELTMDDLKVINSIELTTDAAGAADLPDDYLDWVAVGQRHGQRIQPIAQRSTIGQLVNYDSNGTPIPFGSDQVSAIDAFGTWPASFYWTNVNEFNEYLGRGFGYNFENASNIGFKVFRERGQIQAMEGMAGRGLILDYISNGQSVDNATRVNPYAQATIDAYINWKRSPSRDNSMSPEANSYNIQRKQMRRRIAHITVEDIRRVIQSTYKLSNKN